MNLTSAGVTPKARRLPARLVASGRAHPVLLVTAVAAAVRLAFALASFVLNRTQLIGDEIQYIQLAHAVASGKGAESWVRFYGQSLYNSTWTYCAPLAFLFRIFGTSRLWGQLLSAVAGTATAAITTRLLLETTRRRLAVAGGLVVALLPSQVLWSAVVLRESTVWVCLALVALGLMLTARRSNQALLVGVGAIAVGLLGMAFLRQQTLVAAVWAAALAAPFVARRHWMPRAATAVALALTVPILAGIGPGGWTLVHRAAPSLGTTRTYMALNAQSAFTATTLASPPPSTPKTTIPRRPPSGSGGGPEATTTTTETPTGGALGIANRQPPVQSGHDVVDAGNGEVYSVDNGVDNLAVSFVPGLLAVSLRPYPWEGGSSLTLRLASFEDLAWYVLYAFAALGVALGWRRHRAVTLFAFLLVGNIIGIGALTQGNLGTAFRHRGQIVWALAVLAAVGVEELLHRWSRPKLVVDDDDEDQVLVHS